MAETPVNPAILGYGYIGVEIDKNANNIEVLSRTSAYIVRTVMYLGFWNFKI